MSWQDLSYHADGTPVDLERLHEASDGDAEFERELVDIFLADSTERLELLRAAIEIGDLSAVRTEAHRLKGSSGSVGACGLYALSRTIEDLAAQAEAELITKTAADLDCEYARVRDFFLARAGQ